MKKILPGVIVFILMMNGCSPSDGSSNAFGSESPRAWFDSPEPGTIYYPPNPCSFVAHGSSPVGVAKFELLVNGNPSTIPSPDHDASLVTLTRDCGISEPGPYGLQLRAQDNEGNWSGYAETYFVIPDANVEVNSPESVDNNVTTTPALTLTPIISTPDELAVTEVSTWVVYVGDSSCGPTETVVTAHATASKGISVALLFFQFNGGEFQNVAMNPIGNDLYRGTINLQALFGNSIPFDSAIIGYQVVVQQSDGDTSLRTSVNPDIEVKACGSSSSAPAVDACSVFVDQRACQANNCNWWQVNATSFVCKSKP